MVEILLREKGETRLIHIPEIIDQTPPLNERFTLEEKCKGYVPPSEV